MSLTTRLDSLVRETADPWIVAYVVNSLGRGPIDRSYAEQVSRQRDDYVRLLLAMLWRPADAERDAVARKLGRADSPFSVLGKRIEEVEKERVRISRIKEAETQAAIKKFLKTQFDAWAKEQMKAAEAMEALYRDFKDEDAVGIIVRLKDEEPLNRWMAIQIVQRRWEHSGGNFLVELLDDPVPLVRQAAHQTLVKLSRGTDHGPSGPNPPLTQVRASQKTWRAYLAMQDGPGE